MCYLYSSDHQTGESAIDLTTLFALRLCAFAVKELRFIG